MAVGTGFAQLLRGLGECKILRETAQAEKFARKGQVGGLAVASAIFQSRLDSELRTHIHSPDAEQVSALAPWWLHALVTDHYIDHQRYSALCTSCSYSPARRSTNSQRRIWSELEVCFHAGGLCLAPCISCSATGSSLSSCENNLN